MFFVYSMESRSLHELNTVIYCTCSFLRWGSSCLTIGKRDFLHIHWERELIPFEGFECRINGFPVYPFTTFHNWKLQFEFRVTEWVHQEESGLFTRNDDIQDFAGFQQQISRVFSAENQRLKHIWCGQNRPRNGLFSSKSRESG